MEPLAAELGQPIVIDNSGGAAGNLGTDIVAKAPADGYTILFTLSSHTINPKLYEKLPFDVERDFAPISLAAQIPQILVANPSVPITSVKELIAYAKANPGKLNYASVGIGSPAHIAGELFKLKTGIDMVHVPVQGRRPGGHRHDRRAGAARVRLDAGRVAAREIRPPAGDRRDERQAQRLGAGRADDRRVGRPGLRSRIVVRRAGAREDAAGDRGQAERGLR